MISIMWEDEKLRKVLRENGVAVMPTDTIYGIVGRAEDESAVDRIYGIKKRRPDKPCIILISSLEELEKFAVHLSPEQKEKIKEYWTCDELEDVRPTSIILDCFEDAFEYLHRGTKTLAFRMSAFRGLRDLIKETGPLIAPSANPEGFPPAKNTEEAKKYFGNTIDLYIDGGTIEGKASRVMKLEKDGSIEILRD